METDISQEAPTEIEAPAEVAETPTEDNSTEQANPFWGEVEKLTGPNVYKTIQPHLAKADTEARNRISELNKGYTPWKAFADQGYTPQHAEQAFNVVKQLNENPEQVYEALGSFLEREGRMPSQQELVDEVDDNEDDDPRDVQLRELQDQQAKVMEFLQSQEQAKAQQQADREADTWLTTEISRVQAAHPDFTDDDMKEIVRAAAFAAQSGQEPNFDQAVAQYSALRDRIRTAPRPTQSAPRVPGGVGGGSPSGAPVDSSAASKQDRINLVADMISRGKQ